MDNKESEPVSASSLSISYLGPAGTYSHQVANTFRIVGDEIDSTISTMSQSTITQAYNSIAHPDRDGSDCCCIPFENSTYGLVSETVSLLTDSNPHQSDSIQIRGEARLPVGHSLLVNQRDYHRLKQQARRRRGVKDQNQNQNQDEMQDDDGELNDEELKGIGMVHSHEQALGQCSNFLTTRCPLTNRSGRRKPNPSTAQASKFIASLVHDPISKEKRKESLINGDSENIQDGDQIGGVQVGVNGDDDEDEEEIINASISSEICTDVYGLNIARRNIQDRNDNTTRFFLISNSEKAHQLTSKPSSSTLISKSNLRTLVLLERTSISSHNSKHDSTIKTNLNLLDLVLSIIYKDSESGLRVRKIDRLNRNLLKSNSSNGTGSRTTNGTDVDESRNESGDRNGIQNNSGADQDEDVDPESTWVNAYLIELEMDSSQSRNLEDFREKVGKIKEEFEMKVAKEVETKMGTRSLLTCLGCWVF